MKKRIFSLALTLCLLLGLMSGLTFGAGAVWTPVIDYTNEQLTGLNTATTYTINGTTYSGVSSAAILESWFGTSVSIYDGVSTQSFPIPARPAAPSGFFCSPYSANIAFLYGTTAAMEYMSSAAITYTACPGDITTIYLTWTKTEVYKVRYKAVAGTSFASADTSTVVYTDITADSGTGGSGTGSGNSGSGNESNPGTSPAGYADVKSGDWYYGAVNYVTQMGLMPGRSATSFAPNVNTTRQEVVSVLYNIAGEEYYAKIENTFTDVADSADYLTAVLWGVENEIVTGYSGTSFGPGDNVTREQLAAFCYRLAGHLGYTTSQTGSLSTYSDSASVSSYATEAMKWAVSVGIINGVGGNQLSPQGNATRAQVAAITQRFMKLK